MHDPVLAFFLDYWNEKRGTRRVPRAHDFVPKDVGKNLRWLVVADALPGNIDFRFRVIGTMVCEYFLGDGTGKTVLESFTGMDELGQGIVRIYSRTCTLERPIHYAAPATVTDKLFFPAFDALYLPYSTTGERADRLVNAFIFSEKALRAHR